MNVLDVESLCVPQQTAEHYAGHSVGYVKVQLQAAMCKGVEWLRTTSSCCLAALRALPATHTPPTPPTPLV